VAPRASSIQIRGGLITVGSSLQPEGKSILELSGKGALGEGGGLHLARVLLESAAPSLLTALDIGCGPAAPDLPSTRFAVVLPKTRFATCCRVRVTVTRPLRLCRHWQGQFSWRGCL
jgi:hypothetical protein